MPYPIVPAKNFTPARRTTVDVVVIHTMESPEIPKTARAVANWFAGPSAPQASAHYCVGPDETIQCVDEAAVAWHAPGVNTVAIGIELTGRASQTIAQWADAESLAVLERAAQLVAEICARWNIPIARLSVANLIQKKRGICGHYDVTMAFHKSTHTDPGPNFPWEKFLARVGELSTPPVG